jgi:two-component system alkaline phosphatase synthesis response regulator PhoP
MARILVVDDEESIVELIRYNLEKEGYSVATAADGDAAQKAVHDEPPDLIILDVMLPGKDGLFLCRTLQSDPKTRKIPIIMISARADEVDRILGLEMGADDYVTKPFSPRELLARVKARLRRERLKNEEKEREGAPETAPPKSKKSLRRGPLVIDAEKFSATLDGERLDLTPKEFELVSFLAGAPGRVFTREELLERIWGYDYPGDSRTVDVHIRHIRQKLSRIPGAHRLIETVRGVGYRFAEVP